MKLKEKKAGRRHRLTTDYKRGRRSEEWVRATKTIRLVMVDVMNPIEEIEANFDHVLIVANCHSQIRTNEQYTELAISIVFQLFAAVFYCSLCHDCNAILFSRFFENTHRRFRGAAEFLENTKKRKSCFFSHPKWQRHRHQQRHAAGMSRRCRIHINNSWNSFAQSERRGKFYEIANLTKVLFRPQSESVVCSTEISCEFQSFRRPFRM